MTKEFAMLLEQYLGGKRQSEICEAIGIDPSHLSRAKQEEGRLGREAAIKIADELGLTDEEWEVFVLTAMDLNAPVDF